MHVGGGVVHWPLRKTWPLGHTHAVPFQTRPPLHVGVWLTPQDEHEHDGLTLPSRQTMRPLAEQELLMPPWPEQQPGHALGASMAFSPAIAACQSMGPTGCANAT
ncbi:MAG: hypothetical protein AMXMBFR59_40310 [Rhodanobacteraceae bacterium]